MTRKALTTAVAVMAAGIMWPPIAHAQVATCGFQLATAGGEALTCPLGGIRNIVDIEGGTEHYENGQLDRSKLDLNISSGEADGQRSRVAINPDVGGPGTVIFDGRRGRIASFYPDQIEFWAPVVFHQGVAVSGESQRRLDVRMTRLRARVARLERRVVRLRSVVRRVLDGRR